MFSHNRPRAQRECIWRRSAQAVGKSAVPLPNHSTACLDAQVRDPSHTLQSFAQQSIAGLRAQNDASTRISRCAFVL
jgi:hypothetical protein